MKTRNIYKGAALLAVALTTAACQNEINEETNQPKPGEKVTMTIRATQGTTPQTRTDYEDKLGVTGIDKVVVKWEGGTSQNAPVEKIKLFGYATGGSKFTDCGTLTSTPSSLSTDGTSITFTGIPTTTADNYIAIYPTDNCILETNKESLTFGFLRQTQDCTAGKEMAHLKKYDIMKGVPAAGTNNYTFTHQAIMLRFDLTLPTGKTDVINKVTLTTSIPNGIYVGMSMMIVGENLPWPEDGTDGKSISLGIKNHTASDNLKAYMMIPGINLTDAATLTITVNTESGNTYTGTLNTAAGTTLTAGNCYTLTPSLVLTETVTVPPVTSGNLGTELDKITSLDPKQTELVLTGEVNSTDIANLASFLSDTKAANITTLDLSDLIYPDGASGPEVVGLANCNKLVNVILPKKATAIGDNAFSGCTALTTVTQNDIDESANTRASIPSRVKTVGASAFKNCTSMTEMFLHANITSIGANAFNGCSSLTALVFEGTKAVGSTANDIKLTEDIITDTHANLKIFLPNITADNVAAATTYKTLLKKPTYYNFSGYGSATTTEEKVDTESYTEITDGDDGNVGDFTPGGDWGGSTAP